MTIGSQGAPQWASRTKSNGSNKSNNLADASQDGEERSSALIASIALGVGEPHEWPPTVPLRPASPPTFDVKRLGKLAPMVEAVAASLQVPVELPAMNALAAASVAVGGRRFVSPKKDWHEPVAFYGMTVCPPGELKSPTLAAMTEPLHAAEEWVQKEAESKVAADQQRRSILEKRKDAAEQRAGKAKKGNDYDGAYADAQAALQELEELGPPVVLPEFFADDATPEALAWKMHEQGGRLAVLSAEGSFLGNAAGRYSNGTANPEIILKAWSHERHPIDRMGRRAVVSRPSLTIGLSPQPGLLTGLGKSADVFEERGMFARFLIMVPTSRVGSRTYDSVDIPDDVREEYATRLATMVNTLWNSTAHTRMGLDEEAKESFKNFWTDFEAKHANGGELTGIEAWAKKFPGQLLRIAAIVTLFDDPESTTITGAVMDNVIALAPCFMGHARLAADMMSVTKQSALGPARAILKWIERKITEPPESEGSGPFTSFSPRDAFNGVHNQKWASDGGQAAVDEALAVLDERSYIRRLPPPPRRPGRPPSLKYEINPKLTEQDPGDSATTAPNLDEPESGAIAA